MTPEEARKAFDEAPEVAEARKAFEDAPDAADLAPVPGDEPGRKIGEPTDRERRWGQIVSFMSGSPLFGTVSKAADSLTGQTSQKSAQRATEQFSPKVAGVPVLPVLGGIAATAPAGAARIGGTVGGMALNTARASAGARVGLQAGLGGVQAADRGGDAGDVALGTGMGALSGFVGEGVGAGLTKLGAAARPAAEKFANSQAIKALLGGGTMVNRLKTQLGVTDEAGLQALGADVRGLGVLGTGPIPRSVRGINEGVEGVLASSGDEIGRIRELADALVASGKATPANAVEVAQAYERGVLGASRLADQSDVAREVADQGQKFVRQATPPLGGVPTTEGGTFKGLWDQSSRMQRGAFKPTDSLGEAAAKKELSRAGVQAARGNLTQQMEPAVGPDEMRNLAEAMKRYSTAARIGDVVEDSAGRSVARSAIGLNDHQLAQTVGATGAVGMGIAGASSLVRGRGNAAAAMYAPIAGKVAGPALGLAGGVSRFAVPAAARQSIADPMGPLRQYLGLSDEERNEANASSFERAP